MGYCIDLTDHNFKIKKENGEKALESLKEFMKDKIKLSWVTPSCVVNCDDIFEAFDEIRYNLTTNDNGDYVLDYFGGEKLGDDEEILNSFAKYVEPNSFIEFAGECGEMLKFEFDGQNCKLVWF